MEKVVKKKSLNERKESLRERMTKFIVESASDEKKETLKVYVHVNDLKQDYKKEDFKLLPGEFMIDKNRYLSICLGAGISPNMESPHALWFL